MEHLQKSIEDLTTALINLAKEESTKGTAEPEEEVLLQPRCKDFRYTEKGVETGGSEGEYINQKTWFRATIGSSKR